MNNFQRITASRETLAAFLGTIPAIETPWDDAFHRLYCSSCSAADCDDCRRQKHRIFAIRADVEPREMSLEESIKMSALMRGMSDESPLRAIEAGK